METAADFGAEDAVYVAFGVGVEVLDSVVDRQRVGSLVLERDEGAADRRQILGGDDPLLLEHPRVNDVDPQFIAEAVAERVGDLGLPVRLDHDRRGREFHPLAH